MERATETLILDASVVIKWFVAEEDSDKALSLREKHVRGELTLMAPDLLAYEVCNALRYNAGVTSSDLKKSLELIFSLELDFISPNSELVVSAGEIARRLGVSSYDASYVALAKALSCSYVTADRRLVEKARDEGKVVLLGSDE